MNQSVELSSIGMESEELWQTIVNAMEELDTEIARSLRILLFMVLRSSSDYTKKHNFIDLITTIRLFMAPSIKRLPKAIKGRILVCMPYSTPSNVRNIIPVAREVKCRGLLCGIIIGEDCIKDYLSEFRNEVPIISARELFSYTGLFDRGRSLRTISHTYKDIIKVFDKKYPHFSLRLKRNYGHLIRLISTSLRMGVAFKHLLDMWSPSFVISTSDFWPFEHQLFCQSSRLGIPSAVVQHGVINNYWWPFVADQYLLWGNSFVQEMLELGAPPNRLMICGMPATDELFRKYNSMETDPIINNPPVCLILSHSHARTKEPELFNKYGKILRQVVTSTPFIQWKIKLHHNEDDLFYRELGDEVYKQIEIYPKTISLEKAVKDADVVSTLYSTAGLEAMIMQRPLIIFDIPSKVRKYAWWPQFGGGIYASTAREFKDYLTSLSSDKEYLLMQLKKQSDFLAECFANRGHAAMAVVNLLEQYCP